MKKDTQKLIQNKLFKAAITSIFRVIVDQRKGVLTFADGYVEKDYVIIVFNDLYGFQFKWANKNVLCVNGAAKSIAIDVLDYSPRGIDFAAVEKKMLINGRRVWQNGQFN